jgi:hypothetical protein
MSRSYKLSEKSLVVCLYGGPGSGKSTCAAGIFYDLKNQGINCEYAPEIAKEYVWEKRYQTFKDQIYIFGKQYHRIFRLIGQLDVIVTDSPILLTPIYDEEKRDTLKKLVLEEHHKMWTYNVFLHRIKPYNSKGRNQNEEESRLIDIKIVTFLDENNIPFEVFDGSVECKNKIVEKIKMLLKYKNEK